VDSGREITIRTVGLTKRYGSGANEVLVFDDLNLEILSGERVALVGESGAGKSSLLHLLGGLDRPTKGRILFGTRDISELDEAELAEFRNHEIGFVWQTHYLLPEFTAMENVMMPLLIRGVSPGDAAREASDRLAEVGLAPVPPIAPESFPEANSSGLCWPGPWWAVPVSCWRMSRPAIWTMSPERRSPTCSTICTALTS
jgi:ABC-type antimicrobial peptide transport system, ATPase component